MNTGERQIGLVTILKDRMYDNIMVPSGTYPVFEAEGEVFWRMDGYLAEQKETKIRPSGDGLFGIWLGGDTITLTSAKKESNRFTSSGFSNLLQSPLCQPGDEQRLSFDLWKEEVMPRLKLTREIAHAYATDEANRSMRAAGRSIWNEDDYNAAVITFNRLMEKVDGQ